MKYNYYFLKLQGRDQLEAETLHSQLISEASRQYAKLYQNMQKGRDTLHNTASCDKITRDNASRSAFSKPAPSHMVDKILSSNNQQSSTDNNRVNDDRGKVEVESPDIRTQQHLANYWLHMSRIYGLNGSAGGAFSPPVNPLAFTAMGAAGNAPAMPDNIQHHEMMLQRQQMLYQQLLYYKNHAAAAAANIMNVHHPGHQRILPAHGPLSPNGNFTDKLKSPRGDEGVQDLRHRIQSDKEVISQPDMNQVRSTGRKMADNFETYPRKSSHAGIRRPSTPEKKRKLSEANNNTSSRGNSMFLNLQKPHHQAFEAMVPPPPHVQASIELEKRKKLLLQHHSELMHHLIPMPRHESHLIPGLHFPFLPTGSAAAIPSSTCASSPPLLSPISPHSVTSSSGSSSSMISPSLSSPVSPLGHPFPHPMMHSIPHPHHHLPPHLSPTSPLYSGSAAVLGYGGVRRPRDPNKPPPLKKYKCDICAKAFSRSNTLVTHRVSTVLNLKSTILSLFWYLIFH